MLKADDFLEFLAETLMAEEPLSWEEELPEEVFDSTGKLLFVTAMDKLHGKTMSVEAILKCKTPRDLFTVVSG